MLMEVVLCLVGRLVQKRTSSCFQLLVFDFEGGGCRFHVKHCSLVLAFTFPVT